MENITAYTGEAHVTSNQFRAIISSLTGVGSYIADIDEHLEPELSTDNTVKIHSGVLFHHGHVMRVPPGTYDPVTYINGTQGMKRIDLVVARYTKDSSSKKESSEWVVIQGTPAASDPVVPEYTMGNMQDGDSVDDCPVFELHFDGLNVTSIEKVLETFYPINDMADKMYPAGTLYMSVNNVNPGEIFGGLWESWGAGRVPVGVDVSQSEFNAAGKTGGSKNIDLSHSHMVDEHHHVSTCGFDDNSWYVAQPYGSSIATCANTVHNNSGYSVNYSSYEKTSPVRLGHTGDSSPGTDSKLSNSQSILQPYITCYMWVRTA